MSYEVFVSAESTSGEGEPAFIQVETLQSKYINTQNSQWQVDTILVLFCLVATILNIIELVLIFFEAHISRVRGLVVKKCGVKLNNKNNQ